MARVDTPLCKFGEVAKPFSLKDAHGQLHEYTSLQGDNGLLVAFICNHCPYVIAIIERLVTDANALQAAGVGVVAVMSNNYQQYTDDSPQKMIQFADKYQFTFPYLVDEHQSVAHAYGAVCTPDFFGYNAKGELQYRGRLDDARMADASQRSPELLNAMLSIAATGNGPVEQTASMGCSIKWR